MTDRVKFVSYNGKYSYIDGQDVQFSEGCLSSGGRCGFDDEWNEWVFNGDWSVSVPEEYKELKDEITEVINDNIPHGCCGGCL